ncbi:MAG: hypothetical protein Q8S44_10365 [Flavobacteriaceae bacterium]|nr:hypothetical protein [Flavobacteriaceae bacterium]
MKSIKFKILALFTFLFVITNVFAHKPVEPPVPGRESAPPPVGVPIDGGLGWLLLLGSAYGVYNLKKNKKT